MPSLLFFIAAVDEGRIPGQISGKLAPQSNILEPIARYGASGLDLDRYKPPSPIDHHIDIVAYMTAPEVEIVLSGSIPTSLYELHDYPVLEQRTSHGMRGDMPFRLDP